MDRVLIPPVAAESAVLVPVPEAERAVGGHRDRLDPAAAWGVPAARDCPLPVRGAGRDHRHNDRGPYDAVPHLTVGDHPAGGVAELRAAETDVQRWLPIQTRVSQVWLMTGSATPGSWRTVAQLPLAVG